jgi:hypothetical protein
MSYGENRGAGRGPHATIGVRRNPQSVWERTGVRSRGITDGTGQIRIGNANLSFGDAADALLPTEAQR